MQSCVQSLLMVQSELDGRQLMAVTVDLTQVKHSELTTMCGSQSLSKAALIMKSVMYTIEY